MKMVFKDYKSESKDAVNGVKTILRIEATMFQLILIFLASLIFYITIIEAYDEIGLIVFIPGLLGMEPFMILVAAFLIDTFSSEAK